MRGIGLQETVYGPGLKHGLPTKALARIARIFAYILVGLIVVLFAQDFFFENLQILLPAFAAIGIFLCFSFRLRSQIRDNIFGEIGFLYLAFAVVYTIFPAFGLIQDPLASGVGLPILETLRPAQGEMGLQLWRQVLFIAAVALGYLLFRAGNRPEYRPKFGSFVAFGGTEKLIVGVLLVAVIGSGMVLWGLSAPVNTYVDYYTRYDHLPWVGLRVVAICTFLKTGGTFVLLTIMFRNYKRYRLYIWPFVLLRVVQEVLGSLGARIDAFVILITAAALYHYCVKRISLRKGLLTMLVLGIAFSAIEVVRSEGPDSLDVEEAALQGHGVPVGELMAVFIPGFQLYHERSIGALPPVPWQLFLNDLISIVPFVDDHKWQPMYWWTANYAPDAVVPPITLGPIAMSALGGGEIGLFVQGFINGILFAFLMRWFAKSSGSWRVMTVYVFCYATCVMCLKYSIFYHFQPLIRTILPVVLLVSIFCEAVSGRPRPVRAASLA
jgi:hypothetical protein